MQSENLIVICLVYSLAVMVLQVESVQVCGEHLPELLTKICTQGYNSKIKRNYVLPDHNAIDTIDSDLGYDNFGGHSDQVFDSQPLLNGILGESAFNLVKTRRRRYMGIHDECCLQSCTYAELNTYCRQ